MDLAAYEVNNRMAVLIVNFIHGNRRKVNRKLTLKINIVHCYDYDGDLIKVNIF